MPRTHSKEKELNQTVFILSAIVFIETIFIAVLLLKQPLPKPVAKGPAKEKGRIAIVIDDWGYNRDNFSRVSSIKYPLTMAVLPNLAYSVALAHSFHQVGFEVIVHMPMEPHERLRLEKNTILTTMDEARIRDIISNSLQTVPYAKGISNHMGSKVTENMKIIGMILPVLKKDKLYFLDSYVTTKSQVLLRAKESGVPAAKRNVFLDNKPEKEYIRGQLTRLVNHARLYGSAIGIGHDRQNTIEVLNEMIPALAGQGYKFVFVSQLVQ